MRQPIAVLNKVAASSTNTYYSEPWSANVQRWGATIVTSGTLTGTWTLWVTDHPEPDLATDDDWVEQSSHADFVETNPAGAATKWRVNTSSLVARRARLKYVNASGTGNLTARVTTV